MYKLIIVLCSSLLLSMQAPAVEKAPPLMEKGALVAEQAQLTVTAIDLQPREVTLRKETGEEHTFTIS